MFGGAIDPAMLESPRCASVLEAMIGQRPGGERGGAGAHVHVARGGDRGHHHGHLREDGSSRPRSTRRTFASQGVSDQGNVANLQSQIPLARMAGAIADTAIAPRSVVAKINALEAQRREVSDARLEIKQYLPQVKVSDEQVKAIYEANQADFRTPERVRVEYVVLSAEALARRSRPSRTSCAPPTRRAPASSASRSSAARAISR